MRDLFVWLLYCWFVWIPILAGVTLLFLAALAFAGAPLWLLMWWGFS